MPASRHPAIKTPPAETVLWRYLDFTKFISMLDSSSLFFTRSDLFDDPFEGSYPKANVEARQRFISDLPDAPYHQTAASFEDATRAMRRSMYVNCWHSNDHESAAMWGLYAKSKEAVALRTSVGRLCEALPSTAWLGKVEYIDFSRDSIPDKNAITPFLNKRRSFEHEHEVRAIYPRYASRTGLVDDPNAPAGVACKVDLNALIEAIYVAPASPTWFVDLVARVSAKLDIAVPVLPSELDAKPVF